jgi:type IV secretion system protein VirB4
VWKRRTNRVQNLAEISRENDYVPYLPYLRHASDEVIIMPNGCGMRVFELRGRSFETDDFEDLVAWHNKLNIAIRSIADDRFSMWTHIIRRPIEPFQADGFRSDFARALDAKYHRKLVDTTFYENRFYVTIIVKPVDMMSTVLSKWVSGDTETEELNARDLGVLDSKCRDFAEAMKDCAPTALKTYAFNGVMFSRPLEVLHYIMTGDDLRIPLVDGPIGQALYSSRIIFGKETIEVRLPHKTHYAAMFGIRDYVVETRTGQFNSLLALDMPFVLTQSFTSQVKGQAMDKLAKKQRQFQSSEDAAVSQADAIYAAMDQLMGNEFVMGDHHWSLMVMDGDPNRLLHRVSVARSAAADTGMVIARESLALEASFWAQLPGNWQMRARPAMIKSTNFAALSPFYTYPAGNADDNWWGGAVALLKTNAAGAFWFNFHVDDLGHTLIIGPSGGGKTVLQNFLQSQLEKLDVTQVFIDKDRGAEIFVRAVGGTYLPLQNGKPTGFAPLRAATNSPRDVAFIRRFIRTLVRDARHSLTVDDERRIDEGVDAVLRLSPEQRSLTEFRALLGFRDAEGIGSRLEKWCHEGALGWAFDNEADKLTLDTRFMGFDMTDFLDNPEIRTPTMMYLFHRIEALLDGRRVVVDIDEFWKALEDDAFKAFANDGLKTFRKLNAMMVFGTQSPADALRSNISHSIIEQTATKILLPNPMAREEEYRVGLGLTAVEFKLIKHDLTPESRAFLIKQGNTSVVARLDLRGMDDELAVLSGRAETVIAMERAIERTSDDPRDWLPAFHEERKRR